MQRIFITGATGSLGSLCVGAFAAKGYEVTAISRNAKPVSNDCRWVKADLRDAAALRDLFHAQDSVVHCASDGLKPDHAREIGHAVISAALEAKISQFVFPSIVGIDAMQDVAYYNVKRELENRLAESGLNHCVQRATQFHQFIDELLTLFSKPPLMILPSGITLQPVDASEVANALVDVVRTGASGRQPDLVGPEILKLKEMARAWRTAKSRRKPMLSLPISFGALGAWRRGDAVDRQASRKGERRWAEWLAQNVERS
jgi:uncharacterized protein YbjT (DUF2867 family)